MLRGMVTRLDHRVQGLARLRQEARNPVLMRVHGRKVAFTFGLLLASILAMAGCSRTPAEDRLRAAIAEMQLGIEQRQPTVVMAHVADNFIGDAGLDRDGLYGLLRVQVLRNASIGATLGPIEIELLEGQAEVRFSALLTGGAGGLLPDRAGTYSVTTGWREIDGNWKLVTASWEREL